MEQLKKQLAAFGWPRIIIFLFFVAVYCGSFCQCQYWRFPVGYDKPLRYECPLGACDGADGAGRLRP